MPKRNEGVDSVDIHGKDISAGGNSKGPEMFKQASKPTCCSHVGWEVESGEGGCHGAGALKVCFFSL